MTVAAFFRRSHARSRFAFAARQARSGKMLLAEHQSSVDVAMRVASRIIEERAELVSRMGSFLGDGGREDMPVPRVW